MSDIIQQNKHELIVQYGKAEFRHFEMLKLKSEFEFVRVNGKKFVGRYFLLVNSKSADEKLRIGIICGRKFCKKAVVRNRARRIIRESFRLIKQNIEVSHIIFIPRKRIIGKQLQDIQPEMIYLLEKAGLWKNPIIKKDIEL